MQSTACVWRAYDATNPESRDVYWEHLPGKLLAQGSDAFWLDSAEPEEYWPHMGDAIPSSSQFAIGNGAEFTNVFPLMHTLACRITGRRRTRASASSCSRAPRFSASSTSAPLSGRETCTALIGG